MLQLIMTPRDDEGKDEMDRRIQREKVLSHHDVVVDAVGNAVEP
jgi:hypothetical protein